MWESVEYANRGIAKNRWADKLAQFQCIFWRILLSFLFFSATRTQYVWQYVCLKFLTLSNRWIQYFWSFPWFCSCFFSLSCSFIFVLLFMIRILRKDLKQQPRSALSLAIFKWMNVSLIYLTVLRRRISANMMLQYQFLNCFWQGSNLWPNGFDDCLVKSYFYPRLPFMRILLMGT